MRGLARPHPGLELQGCPGAVVGTHPGADRRRSARSVRRRGPAARSACCAPTRSPQPRDDGRAGAATGASNWPRTARRTCLRSWRPASWPPAPCAITVATIARPRCTARSASANWCWPTNWSTTPDCAGWPPNWTRDPDLRFVCWVDSVRGVRADDAGAGRRGHGRSTCASRSGCRAGAPGAGRRTTSTRWPAPRLASPRLRLVGVAGYEAALARTLTGDALAAVAATCADLRATVLRLAPLVETDDVVVTAGGSTYFDVVADALTGWPRRPVGAHRAAQRLLPDPRRRPLRADLAADPGRRCRVATRAGGARPGGVAAGTRPGDPDDGPARRVVRPGPAGPAGPRRQPW